MSKIFTLGLDFFFPVLKCPLCQRYYEGLCPKCKDEFIRYDVVSSLVHLEGVSLYQYNQAAKDLIGAFKKKKQFSAGEAIVKLLVERSGDLMKNADLITCAPSSRASLNRLDFDHGAFLIKRISKEVGVPWSLLFTPPKEIQKGLTKEERKENALGISLKKGSLEKYRNKTVIIFDDVWTTGSTLDRCRSLLNGEEITVKYMTFSRL